MLWGAVAAAVVLAVSSYVAFIARGDSRARAAGAAVECNGRQAIEFGCHARRYASLVRRSGPRAALAALDAEQRRNGYVRAACHQLTHRIGRAAGDLRGIAALRQGSSVCVSGYYHGVLQSVMGRLGRRGAVARAAELCAEMKRAGPHTAVYYNCVHGTGHGFMEVFRSDVFRSLSGCESLDNRWQQEECSGGVFMENVSAIDNRARPSRSLRPGRPLFPCDQVAKRFWEQCYDWQITYALYVNDSDFGKVFALCTARQSGARGPCYRGLGGDALQQSKFVTSRPARRQTIRRLCTLGPDSAARSACIQGAVRTMFRDYPDGDRQARALCRSLAAARERGLGAVCTRAEARARRHVPLPRRAVD